MLCKSYAASLMQIQKTQVCLGNNVVKFQLEQAKKELEKRILEKSEYEKEIKNRNQLVTLIDNVEWKAERYNFNSSIELSEENRNLGKLSAQIEELKNSPEMLAAAKVSPGWLSAAKPEGPFFYSRALRAYPGNTPQ